MELLAPQQVMVDPLVNNDETRYILKKIYRSVANKAIVERFAQLEDVVAANCGGCSAGCGSRAHEEVDRSFMPGVRHPGSRRRAECWHEHVRLTGHADRHAAATVEFWSNPDGF